MNLPKVLFFSNGNTAVFRNGQQVGELQKPWLLVFAEFLESEGIDPTECLITLPNNRQARIFKTDEGYNWEL